MEFVLWVLKDMEPGRMFEGLIFILVTWSTVKPHLTKHLVKIETRMDGVVEQLTLINERLESGEKRFDQIENRLSQIENK